MPDATGTTQQRQAAQTAAWAMRIPSVEVDFPTVLARAREIVLKSRNELEAWLSGTAHLTLLRGHARFEGRDSDGCRLRLGEEPVAAAQVVLDTGTRSLIPPIPGLDEVDFLDAENWLDGAELPGRLVVIGGGSIGLEMAQFYRRLGSDVVVIEGAGQIPGHEEDADVASALQQLLEAEGIEFRLNSKITRIERANGGAERVHIYIDVMNAGAPHLVIRDAIHIHPTLAEAVQSAVSALD